MIRVLVYPGQRGFPGHGAFSAKAGIYPDKLGWLVTLPLTTHNGMYLPRTRELQGGFEERPYRILKTMVIKERLICEHLKHLSKAPVQEGLCLSPYHFSFLTEL